VTADEINGLDAELAAGLLALLASLDLQPMTIRGNASKRTVGHFGLRYDYGSHVREVAWQHRIPPTKSERFSLTLRGLSAA